MAANTFTELVMTVFCTVIPNADVQYQQTDKMLTYIRTLDGKNPPARQALRNVDPVNVPGVQRRVHTPENKLSAVRFN
jgi:hypothetical protein